MRFIPFTLTILFFSLLVSRSFAQVSMVSTNIPTGTNYPSLGEALLAINNGIQTGVIVITISGNTNETFEPILDKSGNNNASYSSILIKPAPGTNPVIKGNFTFNPTYPLFYCDGGANVTIDGSNTPGGSTRNLTLEHAQTVLYLTSGVSNSVFRNCIIKSSSPQAAVLLGSGSNNNYNIIENNEIMGIGSNGPSLGIWNIGGDLPNKGNIIRNNKISDFRRAGFQDGNQTLLMGYSDSTIIEGNEFFMTRPAFDYVTAIRLQGASITNMQIRNNRIYNLSSTVGLSGIEILNAQSVSVYNNMISLDNENREPDLYGIIQNATLGSSIKILYNTISLYGTTSGSSISAAFYKSRGSQGDQVVNNIFSNTRTTTGPMGQYGLLLGSPGSGTVVSDHNNIVSTGNARNFVYGTINNGSYTNYSTLASWQSASQQDLNSISIAPVFASTIDLRLALGQNDALQNQGIPIPAITTDIDSDPRNATTPDMGADEISSGCNTPVITTQPVGVSACIGSNANFSVVATGNNLVYQWRRNGINIAGATSASLSVPVNLNASGTYTVRIWSETCSVISNDAFLTVHPVTMIITQPANETRCLQQNVTFQVVAAGGGTLTYQWRKGSTNIAGATSASYTINNISQSDEGQYNVVITGTCGSVTSANASLNILGTCTSLTLLEAGISGIQIMPNLVRNAATVRINAQQPSLMNWSIIDNSGRVIKTFISQVRTGRNDLPLDLGSLPSGQYYLRGQTGRGHTGSIMFIKM
jgi:hypothetical protein